MADYSAILLCRPGEEAGDVHEGDERDVEGVAEPHEARRLLRRIDVQTASQMTWLIGDDAHGPAVEAREAHDDVPSVLWHDLEHLPAVHDLLQHAVHVVGRVGVRRDEGVQRGGGARGGVRARPPRRLCLAVGEREVPEELPHHRERVHLVGKGAVSHPALCRVRCRPPQLLHRHLLHGHGLDDFRACQEHMGGMFDHEGEVGEGGRVHRAPRAGPQHEGELGDDPAGLHVAVENLCVACQRAHPLLNPCASRVIEADNGRTRSERLVHNLTDLLGVGLGKAAPQNREVLRKHKDRAPPDGPAARHHPVPRHPVVLHPEVCTAVLDELAALAERPRVEEGGDPLSRRELPLAVLGSHPGRPPALQGLLLQACDLGH
mmetsp:Transcript_31400/g.100205  ORF Transcript_31400/g.100205 Transcript_31400/m.100205 type:complete len:376 (-) Transcript_31400:367-1494(-)